VRLLIATAFVMLVPCASAQEFRLNDILDSLHRGATLVKLDSADPVAAVKLDSVSKVLRSAGAGSITISALAGVVTGKRAGFGTMNRWDTRATDLAALPWFRDAILLLARIANGVLLRPLRATQPDAVTDGILAPTNALRSRGMDLANQQGVERLRRMEIKYGSASPKLNVVEATANFAFQWIPGLRAAKDGSPSRYEFLAAYRTMEITASKSGGSLPDAQLVSAGQLGMRWYHWDAAWGTGTRLQQLRRPRYASAGLYVIGPADAPLAKITGVRRRHGAFIGWGSIHVAYVHETPRRVLIGSDRLLIPHLF
jgi:hypothetical protein